ncbi:hypothetical protein APHAL10511_006024 [Amanita phalloides]|nr:hypothetical protein APHAL10511_006024 [Amanita phalloides]
MKVDILERIHQVALDLERISHHNATRIEEKNTIRLAALELPRPEEILAGYDLRDIPPGCLEHSLEHLRKAACQRYETVCPRFASTFTNIGDDSMLHLVNKLRSIYTKMYHEEAEVLIKHAMSLVQKRKAELATTLRTKGRPTFKHQFTPLLEHYFELNPYPSTSDKAKLAKKCTMSTRQIEVWFQNHRNRARKEGRPLRRAPASSVVYDFLESVTPPLHADSNSSDYEDSGYGTQLSDEECRSQLSVSSHQDNEINWLESSVAPSYAFPTRYLESNKPTVLANFPRPTWLRTASPSVQGSVQGSEPIDMDNIVQLFAKKLHVRDNKFCPKRHGEQYWLLSSASVAPKAPHPALVRSTGSTKSKSIGRATAASQKMLFKSAGQSSSRFHSPNLASRHISVS